MSRTEKKSLQVRYLLGDLSDQENVRIEESYFDNDEHLQELEIVEDELVDAYVHGELDQLERQKFEKLMWASTRISERVQFARMLANAVVHEHVSPVEDRVATDVVAVTTVSDAGSWWRRLFPPEQSVRPFAFAGSAALILIVAGLLFAWMRALESSRQAERQQAALQQQKDILDAQSKEQLAKINQLSADLEKERSLRAQDHKLLESLENSAQNERQAESRTASIASIILLPGLTRDGSNASRSLTVRPGQSSIRLLLSLPADEYKNYRATIKDENGAEVLHKEGLTSWETGSGRRIVFQFPATSLSSGEYVVSLSGRTSSGFESIADYGFRLAHAR